ncbi:hypothetical protein Hanom_Chr01g00052911 [Helianthus anomalus]
MTFVRKLDTVCDVKTSVFQIMLRVKYMDGPCGLPKIWIWSLAFRKYIDGPCGLHFVTHLVLNLYMLKPLDLLAGDNALQSANHRDHLCTLEN